MSIPIVTIWLIFRLLTSTIMGVVSDIRPATLLEHTIPFVPPSRPIVLWLERTTLTPWLRWDARWYLRIVEHGYMATDGTAQFHPLFPWLARILSFTGIHPLLSLMIVSSISSLAFLYIYYQLARFDLSNEDTQFSLVVLLLAPAAFILFAPYSEALFLLCAASSLHLARRKRWWWAGLAGGLAVLTRQQGLFLAIPLVWELWDTSDRSWQLIKKSWHIWLAPLMIPVSYLTWIIVRLYAIDGLRPDFSSFHNAIFSILVSPSASKVVPKQEFTWPWNAIKVAIQKLIEAPDVDIWMNLIFASIFLSLLILSWNNLRPAYRLYVICITLISFSYSTGVIHPYMGLPRHLLLAFPVLIYAAPKLNRPVWRGVIIAFLSVAYLFTNMTYSLESWIP